MSHKTDENSQPDTNSYKESAPKQRWPETPESYILGEKIVINPRYLIFCAYCAPLQQRCAIALTQINKFYDPIQYEKQVWLMKAWRHPNLLPCYCSFRVGNNTWIVTKPLHRGSLLDIIEFRRLLEKRNELTGALEPEDVAYIVKEVLLGLHHLHKHGWIHKGICSRNILLDLDGGITIGGFDKIEKIPTPDLLKVSLIEELYWAAPEIIKQKERRYAKLNKFKKEKMSCDIWSLGIMMLEMVTQWPPHHHHKTFADVLAAIGRSKLEFLDRIPFPHETSGKPANQFRKMVQDCLQKAPFKRPSTGELLRNSFLQFSKGKENFKETVAQYFPGWEPKIDMSQVHLLNAEPHPVAQQTKHVRSEPQSDLPVATIKRSMSMTNLSVHPKQSISYIPKPIPSVTASITKGLPVPKASSIMEAERTFVEKIIIPTKYKRDSAVVDFTIMKPLPPSKARDKESEVTDSMLQRATRDYFSRATEGVQVSDHVFSLPGTSTEPKKSLDVIPPKTTKSADAIVNSRRNSTTQVKRKTSLSVDLMETVLNVSQPSENIFRTLSKELNSSSTSQIPILICRQQAESPTYEMANVTLTTTSEITDPNNKEQSITHIEQVKVNMPQSGGVKSKVSRLADATRNIISNLFSNEPIHQAPSNKKEVFSKKRPLLKGKQTPTKLESMLSEETESMQGETSSTISEKRSNPTKTQSESYSKSETGKGLALTDSKQKSAAIVVPISKSDEIKKQSTTSVPPKGSLTGEQKSSARVDVLHKTDSLAKEQKSSAIVDVLHKIDSLASARVDVLHKIDSLARARELAKKSESLIGKKSESLTGKKSESLTGKKSDSDTLMAKKSESLTRKWGESISDPYAITQKKSDSVIAKKSESLTGKSSEHPILKRSSSDIVLSTKSVEKTSQPTKDKNQEINNGSPSATFGEPERSVPQSPSMSKSKLMERKSKTSTERLMRHRSQSKGRMAGILDRHQSAENAFDLGDLSNASIHNSRGTAESVDGSTLGLWGSVMHTPNATISYDDESRRLFPSENHMSPSVEMQRTSPTRLLSPVESMTKGLKKLILPEKLSSQASVDTARSPSPPKPASPVESLTKCLKKLTFAEKFPNSYRKLTESIMTFKKPSSTNARANSTIHFIFKDTNQYGDLIGSCHFLYNSEKDSPVRVATHMVEENLISGVQSATFADVLLRLGDRIGPNKKIKFSIVVWPKEFLSGDLQPVLSVVFSKKLNDMALDEVWLSLCEKVQSQDEIEEIANAVFKHGLLSELDIPVFSYNLKNLLLSPNKAEKSKPFYLLSNSKQTAEMYVVKLR